MWGQPALSSRPQSGLNKWWTAGGFWSCVSTAAGTVRPVPSPLAGTCNKAVPVWQRCRQYCRRHHRRVTISTSVYSLSRWLSVTVSGHQAVQLQMQEHHGISNIEWRSKLQKQKEQGEQLEMHFFFSLPPRCNQEKILVHIYKTCIRYLLNNNNPFNYLQYIL